MNRFMIPLVVFLVLAAFLAIGLRLNPREIPSSLIGRQAPAFRLPQLNAPDKHFAEQDMTGRVWLLNIWASWCAPCREEHPLLMQIAQSGAVPIYGLNYKDQPADAISWLERYGDPYALSVEDRNGRVGIDYGVYGVPETYVIDKLGVIRYKRIGPVTSSLWRDKILPLVQELQK